MRGRRAPGLELNDLTFFECSSWLTPEQDLFVNILIRAILDATSDPSKTQDKFDRSRLKRFKEQAIAWMFWDDEGIVAFEDLCENLRLDKKLIRKKIKGLLG
jgi:hypothetical protein